ncbi:hypothetical protein CEXT_151991 [Caerostris extrusa]|uniref:Uncharacterized protein n=1 Tax=Caerostris extrusa TaxID=172846 RepID=A0AAV4XCY4_CAEEX|nr:hypothetical protein CEXT_151991 [Caerostris extrusa]
MALSKSRFPGLGRTYCGHQLRWECLKHTDALLLNGIFFLWPFQGDLNVKKKEHIYHVLSISLCKCMLMASSIDGAHSLIHEKAFKGIVSELLQKVAQFWA